MCRRYHQRGCIELRRAARVTAVDGDVQLGVRLSVQRGVHYQVILILQQPERNMSNTALCMSGYNTSAKVNNHT